LVTNYPISELILLPHFPTYPTKRTPAASTDVVSRAHFKTPPGTVLGAKLPKLKPLEQFLRYVKGIASPLKFERLIMSQCSVTLPGLNRRVEGSPRCYSPLFFLVTFSFEYPHLILLQSLYSSLASLFSCSHPSLHPWSSGIYCPVGLWNGEWLKLIVILPPSSVGRGRTGF
jgi:hypothetical protein